MYLLFVSPASLTSARSPSAAWQCARTSGTSCARVGRQHSDRTTGRSRKSSTGTARAPERSHQRSRTLSSPRSPKLDHLLAVVIKPLAARQRRPDLFATDDDVYANALMYLAERYQRFLARRRLRGDRARQPPRGTRPTVAAILRGTPTRRHTVRRAGANRRRAPPRPLQHSVGLQAADLVTASTLAAQRVLGDASRWHKQLLPRFARHPDTGEIHGVGLVTYPAAHAAKNRRRQTITA